MISEAAARPEFILRPGLNLCVTEMLEEPELKKAYIYLKFLKDFCITDVKSYDLKRILQDSAAAVASESHLRYDDKTMTHLCKDKSF